VVAADIPALDRVGGMDVLRHGAPTTDAAGSGTAPAAGDVADGAAAAVDASRSEADVLVVSVGAMATTCLEVADRLADQGIGVTVVDPRWVKPVDPALAPLAARHRLVVVVEDGVRGGVASAVGAALRDAGVPTPLRDYAVPSRFLDHGKRAQVLAEVGLTAQDISRDVVETVARIDAAVLGSPVTTE
jgi:1-deoxy-D-xylulose-5-phosphate synthase